METRAASRSEPAELASAAVVISHDVEDYAAWKRAFDRHAGARHDAGIVAAHVNQDADNPNRLSVYLAGADRAKLAAFIGDIALIEDHAAAIVFEIALNRSQQPDETFCCKL